MALPQIVAEKGAASQAAVNRALQQGHDVLVEKKTDHPNKHGIGCVTDPKKLDNETEEFSHKHLSLNFKRSLQRARVDKKLTQAELANMIGEKANVIGDYETGKTVPNPAIASKLSRVLDVKLNVNM